MSHVLEINDLETLAQYRLLWEALWLETRSASFFQTLDWLEVYWRHFGYEQTLRVLIVYAEGRPIGILPLCVRREKYKVGTLRVLTYPLHDWGSYYGPLGPNPTATLLAGLRHIRSQARDWDLIDLRWVDQQGVDHGRTARAMEQVGFAPQQGVWKRIACIDVSGTWEDYLARQSSKWRSNLRRSERLLARRGHVEYLHYRPQGARYGEGDPRWELYDACEEVAHRSWQGRATDGTTLSHDSVRPFLRAAHERAAQRGMLDLHLLKVEGEPVAFAYNYCHDGRVQGLRLGYVPELAACGLGHLIYHRAIQTSFSAGDQHYDLAPDYFAGKAPWMTHLETSYRYTYYPSQVRVQALRAKRALAAWWTGSVSAASSAAL